MLISRIAALIWGSLIRSLVSFMISVDFCNDPVTFVKATKNRISYRVTGVCRQNWESWGASVVVVAVQVKGCLRLTELILKLYSNGPKARFANAHPVAHLVASDHLLCKHTRILHVPAFRQVLELPFGLVRFSLELRRQSRK